MIGWISSGVRLRVDEFDQELFSTDAIVVANARFRRTCPREMDIFPAVFINPAAPLCGDLFRGRVGIGVNKFFEQGLLILVELTLADPFRFSDLGLRFAGETNFFRCGIR